MKRLGKTDIMTPSMVLGGNVFSWTADAETSFAILDRYADAGGTLVDTADYYNAWIPGNAGGESETIIGDWFRQSGRKLQIATKMGLIPSDAGEGLSPGNIAAACDASLRRLGIDTIDIYFAHLDDAKVPQEDVLGAFERLIDAGKVRHLGASNFPVARFRSALDIAASERLTGYSVYQPEYNLVAREGYDGELRDLCIERGVGVIPYFGLASGFLTGKYRSLDDIGNAARGARVRGLIERGGLSVLEAMDAIAADTGATLSQIALAWLGAQPDIAAPIASATSIAQLDELIAGWQLTLTASQVEQLNRAGQS